MATITGLTAERMLAIEAASVVDGDVVGDDLFLTRKDGTLINAGNVRGGPGPVGPQAQGLAVVTAQPVLDVGMIGQIRAGRQLALSDFTNMGLSAPAGLWNLSNFNDSSGNGRTLTNKGAVPLGAGINGLASTAAVFSGSLTQGLYIADTGAADPFRLRMGTFGGWFRTAKRGIAQNIIGKVSAAAGNWSWALQADSANFARVFLYTDGTSNAPGTPLVGITDICDDRWHFVVATSDGAKVILYVDGARDAASAAAPGLIFPGAGPLGIGNWGLDAANNGSAGNSSFGRVDEPFATHEVLTEDQIRNLYAASIPHALGSVPSIISLSNRRRRRGAPLGVTDFPAQPVRLHNFVGGALTDQGSNNVPLTNTPGFVPASGPDGTKDNAYHFGGAGGTGLSATDAGLPTALAPRSYGLWVKAPVQPAVSGIISWGSGLGSGSGVWLGLANTGFRYLYAQSAAIGSDIAGPDIVDGLYHHVVMVENDAATDGVKRKMYVDGRCVGGSTVMASITLGGANRFRLGASADGTSPFLGQISRAFVYAGALTSEQVRALYNISSQQMASSPKDFGEHIETKEAARLLAIFDRIEANDLIDLAVMA